MDLEGEVEKISGELNGGVDKNAIAQRLEEIYKRLELIDAYSAEARAASILAVSFSNLFISMATELFMASVHTYFL